jgi:Uma2 family endonuclease
MPVLTAPGSVQLEFPIYRLSVEQYHGMIRTGIFKDGDQVELLEGVLVPKITRDPPHTYATQTLRDLLPRLLPPGWFVSDQEPITTSDSEPELDLTIVRGDRRQYLEQHWHPRPEDTALVIEIVESSLSGDRRAKGRVYARATIPEYWIVNLVERRVEVCSSPTGPCNEPIYQQETDYGLNDEVPLFLDGLERGRIPVNALLP